MSVHDLKKQAARASAVLTTGEVAGNTLDISKSGNMAVHDAQVSARCAFTVGSLTNVIIRAYTSQDGSTWDLLYGPTGASCTTTLTATDTILISIPPVNGAAFLRVTAQGTGTVTNSLLAIDYLWLRKGTQV